MCQELDTATPIEVMEDMTEVPEDENLDWGTPAEFCEDQSGCDAENAPNEESEV